MSGNINSKSGDARRQTRSFELSTNSLRCQQAKDIRCDGSRSVDYPLLVKATDHVEMKQIASEHRRFGYRRIHANIKKLHGGYGDEKVEADANAP